ncbi:LytR/AlgR family response regulator transcription factor [Nonlabens xiamenensis]|uniref:LytR/AlgR family response regulator transcription factor n=1 Tax=Nonlabens xiamenensis TaxID=2341043 RepID=UPI000F605E4F|nr:LytTR family DNA-binding domain-containing protein [Nonlabens xiamenensis]
MSLKLVSIDDEKYIRDTLIHQVQSLFPGVVEVAGQAESVETGKQLIIEVNPDIVLLDIELGDGSAFDLLNALPNTMFELIFVTGYDQHAIEAIRLGALDYILKPIDPEELQNAMDQAIINARGKRQDIQKILGVAQNFYAKRKKQNIVLKTLEGTHILEINKIMYCSSEGNYTTFYLEDETSIMISKPLKFAVELLPEAYFVRCQQSYLVNVHYVGKLVNAGSLILKNGTEIPVSGARKEQVFQSILNKMN